MQVKPSEKEKQKEKEFLRAFSKGIQSFLKRKGYKINSIANELGVSVSCAKGWKYGRAFTTIPNYLKLVALGMSPYEIMPVRLMDMAKTNEYKRQIETNNKLISQIEHFHSFDTHNIEKLSNVIRSENLHLEEEIKKLNAKEPECHAHLNEKNP